MAKLDMYGLAEFAEDFDPKGALPASIKHGTALNVVTGISFGPNAAAVRPSGRTGLRPGGMNP